jgi:hypothetical protein
VRRAILRVRTEANDYSSEIELPTEMAVGLGDAPTRFRFGEGQCLRGRNGRMHPRGSRNRGPHTWRKISRDNVGKGLCAAGIHNNLQGLVLRAKAKGTRGHRSGA